MLNFFLMDPEDQHLYVDGAFEDEPATWLYGIDIELFHALKEHGLVQAFDEARLSCFDDAVLDQKTLSQLKEVLENCASNKLPKSIEGARVYLIKVFNTGLEAKKAIGVVCA